MNLVASVMLHCQFSTENLQAMDRPITSRICLLIDYEFVSRRDKGGGDIAVDCAKDWSIFRKFWIYSRVL